MEDNQDDVGKILQNELTFMNSLQKNYLRILSSEILTFWALISMHPRALYIVKIDRH